LISNRSAFQIELSGKFELFRAILNECESIGDKLLVFTRSLLSLDYIEQWLERWNARSTTTSKWVRGVDYFRMDGKVSIKQRAEDIKTFNQSENTRARLFLISTMAGGIGINLYSANRVIIFDVSWNPGIFFVFFFKLKTHFQNRSSRSTSYVSFVSSWTEETCLYLSYHW